MTLCLLPRKQIVVLFLYLLLLGCSGGDGNGNPPPPPLSCDGTGPSGPSQIAIFTEVEPNNDLASAFGVAIPTPTADRGVGLLVGGTVHESADRIDVISFTSTRTIRFFVKLCEDSCNIGFGNDQNGNPDSLDTSIAYFDVMDASGMVIGSSLTNVSTENYTELCIEGGVITYIQVIANNTLNAAQDYRVSAMETH